MNLYLKNGRAEPIRIVYANWPEGYVNQRFINALAKKYKVSLFFFDDTIREKEKAPPISVPKSVKKISVKDPPLVRIPLDLRLATKSGSVGWFLKMFVRGLIFRRSIKRLRPDLLIVNGITGTNPFGLCGASSGFHPFVVLVWGSDILIEARDSVVFRMIAKFVLRRADGVLVDSEVKARAAVELGCSRNKIWKFPWGIDLDLFNSSTDCSNLKEQLGWEDKDVIVSTRNHYPIYGVEYLVRAIPTVVKEIPDARFLIIGEGPCTNNLKEKSERLGIVEYVRFIGKVPNKMLAKYLGAADVYVSTAFSDGASNSLLESMACGLPVVVTDIPGNQEWIQNGKNGFLVPIKDSKALAERIVSLLRNKEMRKFASDTNSELAKAKADWKKNANVLYETVERLVADARASAHIS